MGVAPQPARAGAMSHRLRAAMLGREATEDAWLIEEGVLFAESSRVRVLRKISTIKGRRMSV